MYSFDKKMMFCYTAIIRLKLFYAGIFFNLFTVTNQQQQVFFSKKPIQHQIISLKLNNDGIELTNYTLYCVLYTNHLLSTRRIVIILFIIK